MNPRDLVVSRSGARFMGRRFPCALGKNGITRTKHEGDLATPVGTHKLVALLYRPDRMPAPTDWAVPIGPGDLWSDDPSDAHYNQMVHVPYDHGHERLRRPDCLYDLILTTDWNWPEARAGEGSAIFVHVWRKRRFPTAGCVAFRKPDLLWIIRRMTHRTRLIVRP